MIGTMMNDDEDDEDHANENNDTNEQWNSRSLSTTA